MGLDKVRSETRPKANRFVRSDRANVVRPERVCRRCEARGQDWAGDAPKCGFLDGKPFLSSNWNCATLNALRDHAERSQVYNDDQYAAILPIPDSGEFIVLCWYKHRGRTESACVISGSTVRPLTIRDAYRFLKSVNPLPEQG
jgi:hypothetical protein